MFRFSKTGLVGLVPLVVLFAGLFLGGVLAGLVGLPQEVGAVLVAVASYFLSRAILRHIDMTGRPTDASD